MGLWGATPYSFQTRLCDTYTWFEPRTSFTRSENANANHCATFFPSTITCLVDFQSRLCDTYTGFKPRTSFTRSENANHCATFFPSTITCLAEGLKNLSWRIERLILKDWTTYPGGQECRILLLWLLHHLEPKEMGFFFSLLVRNHFGVVKTLKR